MIPSRNSAKVQALDILDLNELREIWRNNFGSPPKLRSVELLRLLLAWRLQAVETGGLDRDTRRKLQQRGRLRAEGLDLGNGARLRREWQGKIVEVVVTEDGFNWGDKTYRSLSAAATAIAGTRWNGPRFFGLRKPGK